MDIREKITSRIPDAKFTEGAGLMLIVEPDALHGLAETLRNDKELQFDYMQSLTGMDWGEEGLGVVYHFESTVHGHQVVVKTMTTDRECPMIPSVADIWKTAELNEREAYDFFGIYFVGHQDMRRLYLRDEWVGYPLRKDYDESEEINPLRMTNESTSDITYSIEKDASGEMLRRARVLFNKDEYVLNVGPQHPATHGVLRFRVSLEGEVINKIDANCGYIHRGIEKMCESLTYPQILALTDRLDYLGSMQSRHAVCMCVEKALGVEIPERVQYIRTIMDELQRINSHLLFFASLVNDLGAITTFIYGFRDREKVLDILEETTGGRLIFHYNTIGGVQADIHPDFVKKVKELLAYIPSMLREYNEIFTGNIIARQRLIGVGVLSREDAISFGTTGCTGRSSGWACDVRKRNPYAMYDKVDFKEVIFQEGDCYARYLSRLDEIVESVKIIEQLIDNIPEGDYQVKMKPVIRVPEGNYYTTVESSRGEFGVYLESRGEKNPYRIKFRSTGLPLLACIDTITRGSKIADLIAVGGTLDYIVPDIDR